MARGKRLDPEYIIAPFIDPLTKKTWMCWWWQGSINHGYGACNSRNHLGEVLAHRYMYKRHGNKIKKGYDLHHRCTNTECVKPAHLKQVFHGQDHLNATLKRDIYAKKKSGTLIRTLTDKEANKVKRLRSSGMSYYAIEKLTGINQGTAWHIVQGNTYKFSKRQLEDL